MTDEEHEMGNPKTLTPSPRTVPPTTEQDRGLRTSPRTTPMDPSMDHPSL